MVALARLGAELTLVPSQFVARHIRGSEILPNWVSLAVQGPAVDVRAEPHGGVSIGFLGRPSLLKGVGTLLDAHAALESREPGRYRLTIAGKAAFVGARESEDLEQSIHRGGPSVRRLGWVDSAEFLAGIDILVVPSVVQESFGLVAAEAMAAKVPVVVSDAGALPEVVGEDHPWIFPAGDTNELARVIRDVASALPADDVVEAAYDRCIARYSRDAALTSVRSLMDRLVGTSARV